MSPGDTDFRLKAVEERCKSIEQMKINQAILLDNMQDIKENVRTLTGRVNVLALKVAGVGAGASIITQLVMNHFGK